MLDLAVLRRVALENGVVALTGHACYSTNHKDWVPDSEDLEWVAIFQETLSERKLISASASTRGVELHFDNGEEICEEDLFSHSRSEQMALQNLLEDKGFLKETRYKKFCTQNGYDDYTYTTIWFDPNNGKIQWFDGSWIDPIEAIQKYTEIVTDLVGGVDG
jgi:hypothetical protein